MKNLTLLILFISVMQSSIAQINIYTNTVWSDISVANNIIIHPGATLTIQDGGLQMAPGKYIHVKDGGQLKGVNGYITAAGAGLWKGIYLDQTLTASPSIAYGIDFYNFRVEDALVAISSAYGLSGSSPFLIGYVGAIGKHNRKIRAIRTIFQKNVADILVHNDNSGGIPGIEAFTHSQISIQFCEFKENVPFPSGAYWEWPVHLLTTKNVYIFNSKFTSNSSQILLHFRNTFDSRVNNNLFRSQSRWYLSFHGLQLRVVVANNQFDLYDSEIPEKVGIDIGDYADSYSDDLFISGNYFFGESFDVNTCGIGTRIDSPEWKKRVVIESNIFENLKQGVRLGNLIEENMIQQNDFISCHEALYFFRENPEVKISCNNFSDCIRDIMIGEDASLQNQNFGYDEANNFSPYIFAPSEPQYNIQNAGSSNFIYEYKDYMPSIPGGINIILNHVDTKIRCTIDNGEEDRSTVELTENFTNTEIKQYPNPIMDHFFFELGDQEITEIWVMDIQGKRQLVYTVSQQNGMISDLDLTSGTYICLYVNESVIVDRKKLVIE